MAHYGYGSKVQPHIEIEVWLPLIFMSLELALNILLIEHSFCIVYNLLVC